MVYAALKACTDLNSTLKKYKTGKAGETWETIVAAAFEGGASLVAKGTHYAEIDGVC